MLTNKLSFIDDSYRMLINADDKLFVNKVKFSHEGRGVDVNIRELVDYYKAKSIECKNMKLCSEDLRTFRFIGWNLETNDEITKLVESITNAEEDTAVIEAHRFDANNLHTSHLNASMNADGGADLDVDADGFDGGGGGWDNFDNGM